MKTLLLFLLPLTTFGQTSFESPFSVLINDGEVDVYHHRVMVNMTPTHVSIGVNDESTPPFTGVVERVEELTNTTMYYLDGAVVKHERFNGFNKVTMKNRYIEWVLFDHIPASLSIKIK